MIEWREEGILLAARPLGEANAIIDAFTPERGRTAGVVRGGASRKIAPILQPGAQVDLTWRARLEEHLGAFTVEPVRSRAAVALSGRMSLAGLNTVTALLAFCLPERAPFARLYRRTEQLLDLLDQQDLWPLAYLQWERDLLEDMGFGLDLSACAVNGGTKDLIYVSPRTGRAVSKAGAGVWASRLLPLPDVLRGLGPAPDRDIAEGLRTTGYFMKTHLAAELGDKPLPEARARFVSAFERSIAD